MEAPNLASQYSLFAKYYNSAYENSDLKDYQTANQLRAKMIPQIEVMLNDKDNAELGGLFELFSEFLFEYYLCLSKNNASTSNVEYDLKLMSEKAIKFNTNSFLGHFFLAVYHSFHLSSAHAGSGDAIYKGRDAAETIVGTLFSLVGKGLTLGATATASQISKSQFTNSVKKVIEIYQINLTNKPFSAKTYLKMTGKMFSLAEFCETNNNPIWKDIYRTIKGFDLAMLDFSEFDDEVISEAKEQAMEMIILADAKI